MVNWISMITLDVVGSRNGHSKANSREFSANLLLTEERFQSMLRRESKRSERSGKHLLLMLVDHGEGCEQPKKCRSLMEAAEALGSVIRDTDIAGWFDPKCVLGVIFTEFGHSDVDLAARAIEAKVTHSLQRVLTAQQLKKVHISFYAFPENESWIGKTAGEVAYPAMELHTKGNDLLAACNSILHFRSTVADLCSAGRPLRLD
jgi:hypothetical protein